MKISEKGLDLIRKFEGCRLTAYQDAVGVWTIGYGTTNADRSITGTNIGRGLQISLATANDWLRKSVDAKYGPKVDKYSKYNWTQNEFDALVSFAYNIGSIDQLTASGTRTKAQIAEKMLAYNRAGGKVLAGLTRRRQEERALFLTAAGSGEGSGEETSGTSASSANKTAVESAKSKNTQLAGTYVVTASALHIRAGAGSDKASLGTLKNGTTVRCYGYYTEVSGTKWLYVVYNGQTGYCSSKYLKKQ